MSNRPTLRPADAEWLSGTIARNKAHFAGWRMEAEGEKPTPEGEKPSGEGEEQTFKQADVDRIVADRLKREREAVKVKFADYDDLKKKAEGAKSAEDRIADLEKQITSTQHEALRRRVQAAHGISDTDADLFLTGTDEESLTAQAKRLAEREDTRKKQGNVSPREGNNPKGGGKDDPMREFTRNLFAQASADD